CRTDGATICQQIGCLFGRSRQCCPLTTATSVVQITLRPGEGREMSMFTWKVVHGGKTPPPGESVGPMERLSWGRTSGLGAQHVVAMCGATFVFPIIMGLDPNLAILMSGI